MKVKEIMTARSLKYCGPETKLQNAAKLMKAGNCGALPVLNKQKQVIGMITDRDIALSLVKKQPDISKTTVGQVISKKLYSVNADAELDVALKEMRSNKVGRLPVVDREGKLKGILSMHNLLAQSLSGKTDIGTLSANGESILKTVKALNDRYNSSAKGEE